MIKVSKEIGERLDLFKKEKVSIQLMMDQQILGWENDKNKCLNVLRIDELAECLFLGYQVEETVEEKIIKEYNIIKNLPVKDEFQRGYNEGYSIGVKMILNKYDKVINGINA